MGTCNRGLKVLRLNTQNVLAADSKLTIYYELTNINTQSNTNKRDQSSPIWQYPTTLSFTCDPLEAAAIDTLWPARVATNTGDTPVATVFRPSSSRISNIFDGKSSMGICTRERHSGQRSSCLVETISSRQRRQNVCWHGSTLLLASNRSKHTEHSSSSFSVRSSMLLSGHRVTFHLKIIVTIFFSIVLTVWATHSFLLKG